MRRAALPLLIAALAGAVAPQPKLPLPKPLAPKLLAPERPVMVGRIPDLDACFSNAKVTGLNPRGENFLAVRSRPATSARELGRLGAGQFVWVCDETGGRGWSGVIYSPPGREIDCGVATPAPRRQPYRGPCASGWVASRYLTIIAG